MIDSFSGVVRPVPSSGRAGPSRAQRTFNALIKQVAARRERLRAWEAVWPAFQQRYVDEWVPLAREASAREAELVRRLDVAFDMKGLTRAERARVSELIVSFARPLLGGAAASDDLREIQARHHPARRARAAAAATPPRMRGRDGGGDGDDGGGDTGRATGRACEPEAAASAVPAETPAAESDDAMMRRIQAELDAQEARASAEARARDAGRNERKRASRRKAADAPPPDGSATSHEEADRSERAAADAVPDLAPVPVSRSLRERYRRLASALHPDREPDPDERARKTELMQRLNHAYDRQDLLQLLELERDLNPADADRLAEASDDLLHHDNDILKAQLGALDRELHRVETDFRHGYGIGALVSLAPDTVLRTLGDDIAGLRRAVAELGRDLQAFRDIGTLKDWLRACEA